MYGLKLYLRFLLLYFILYAYGILMKVSMRYEQSIYNFIKYIPETVFRLVKQ